MSHIVVDLTDDDDKTIFIEKTTSRGIIERRKVEMDEDGFNRRKTSEFIVALHEKHCAQPLNQRPEPTPLTAIAPLSLDQLLVLPSAFAVVSAPPELPVTVPLSAVLPSDPVPPEPTRISRKKRVRHPIGDFSALEKRKRKLPDRLGVVPLESVEDEILAYEFDEIERKKNAKKSKKVECWSAPISEPRQPLAFQEEDDEVGRVHVLALLALSSGLFPIK